MFTAHIHRDIWPHTDHGYTWVESYWFERDGKHVSPIMAGSGSCERLGNLPGGAIACRFEDELEYYGKGEKPERTLKTERKHDGYYHVGSVAIVRIGD